MNTIIQPRTGANVSQFPLRIPVQLRDKLKALADVRGQSMNTLIVKSLLKEAENADT